ncbi:hypothetical protein TorRG33x02_300860, partial [Trema orientale]
LGSVGELVEAAAAGEDDESDIDVAENRELASLFDESIAAFGEGHLATALVLDSLQLHLLPPHSDAFFFPNSALIQTNSILSLALFSLCFLSSKRNKNEKKEEEAESINRSDIYV